MIFHQRLFKIIGSHYISQATGDTGTQWILDLCNGIVKEGSMPDDWKSSVVLPVYKGKGDPMECGSYTTTTV